MPRDWSRWCEQIQTKTEFYIRDIFQWDAVELIDLSRWLNNFPDEQGRYIAMQLLNRFIYYSERDVIELLKHGLTKVLFHPPSLTLARTSNFAATAAEHLALYRQFLDTLIFVPLLDRNRPSESGNTLCRYLNRHLNVPSAHIVQPGDLTSVSNVRVVILDDFIGSGQQIIDFWSLPKIRRSHRLSELAQRQNLEVTYLSLVATRYGLNRIAQLSAGLRVLACEVLEDRHRVFHSPSLYVGADVGMARRYLTDLCRRRRIGLLGFHDLDFAVAFHHAIPDATLPLFHASTARWHHLITRRAA